MSTGGHGRFSRSVGGPLCAERLEGRILLASQFLTAPSYPVGVGPEAVAIADFTGDGRADLVASNNESGTVSVLPGRGDGTFGAAIDSPAGSSPGPIVAADFNKDGRTDLALVDYNAGVLVLLGHGDGTFGAPTNLTPGTSPQDVAVADLNGDGNLDIVATNPGGNVVNVRLGNGDGTFRAVADSATPSDPSGVTTGDFNHDGTLDLAVTAGSSTVGIMLGRGDGTFAAPSTATTGSNPGHVVVGDFNGDGKLDAATANSGAGSSNPGSLSVLLGHGDGTLGSAATYGFGVGNINAVVTGDFNRDGKLDLATVGSDFGRGDASVFYNAGDGTFRPAQNYNVGRDPFGLAAGDLNGDGATDLVTADAELSNPAGTTTVLLNHGDGQFLGARDFLPTGIVDGGIPGIVAVADFDGDGKPDLAVSNGSFDVNTVGVLRGQGDGTFGQPVDYAVSPEVESVAAGDLNGDGKPDLVTADGGPRTTNDPGDVSVLLNRGDGTFATAVAYSSGRRPVDVVIADFNGDGKPDLATVNQPFFTGTPADLTIFLGRGDGTFGPGTNVAAPGLPEKIRAADLNGDGRQDLVTTDQTNNVVAVFLGNGDGTFQVPSSIPVAGAPLGFQIADLNGDRKPDLVTANIGSDNVSVLLGNGDGTFGPAVNYAVGVAPVDVAVADFDLDGRLDLLVVNQGDGNSDTGDNVSLLRGRGDGTFAAAVNFPVGDTSSSIATADLNGDGAPDTVTANGGSGNLTVLLNQSTPPPPPPSASIADVSAVEGDAGTTTLTFTVTLSAASAQPVTIAFATADGTATAGADYTAASGSITFAPGQTSRPITVNILGDTLHEPDETFVVNLSNASGATIARTQAIGTIADDDAGGQIQFASATSSVEEGNRTVTITVNRTGGAASGVTVAFATADGTATAGADYAATSGTLTFGAGETTKTFTVTIFNDNRAELDETIQLLLSGPTGGATLGTASTSVLTIVESNSDTDGVPDDVEAGAPNGGDGNADGIPDSRQPNVASLPNAVDGRYVTLVSPPGTTLVNVRAVPNPSPGNAPAGVEFPVGFFAFEVHGLAAGGATTVKLILPSGVTVDTYEKFGPRPSDALGWYNFASDGTTGAVVAGNVVNLRFVDGQRGDSDLASNGQVSDPGGPAILPRADLTLTQVVSPGPVKPGQDLTFTLTMTNHGPNSATNVVLTDTLPAGVTLVAATASHGTMTQSGQTVRADVGRLAVGASVTITIVVRPTVGGTIRNAAVAVAEETHSALSSDASVQVVSLTASDPTGPHLIALSRAGNHGRPDGLILTFDAALDPNGAANLANYNLVGRGPDGKFGTRDDQRIGLTSAAYDPAARTVTLTLAHRLFHNRRYQLTLNGTVRPGLNDAAGHLLDGDGNGVPGGNASIRFGMAARPSHPPRFRRKP